MDNKKGVIKVVGALIINNGKMLLAKRAKGNLIGEWEFPGGKIEYGETPFQAIEREIKEELDISIKAKEFIHKFEHEYDFGIVHLELIQCEVSQKEIDINLDGSHSEIIFVGPKEGIGLSLAPLDRKIIEYLMV